MASCKSKMTGCSLPRIKLLSPEQWQVDSKTRLKEKKKKEQKLEIKLILGAIANSDEEIDKN